MTLKEFDKLDDSVSSFEFIKKQSEKLWENIELDLLCWGFQIQQNSKWKKGLSEPELKDFQNKVGFEFPDSLKNFYCTMNGLDKPGLNNNGGEDEITYGTTFYSYPDDIDEIKNMIEWVLEENHVSVKDIESKIVSPIFPYYGHRFLILDSEPIALSMYGSDIIYWAENLSKAIASDIFGLYVYGTSPDANKPDKTKFWNTKIQ